MASWTYTRCCSVDVDVPPLTNHDLDRSVDVKHNMSATTPMWTTRIKTLPTHIFHLHCLSLDCSHRPRTHPKRLQEPFDLECIPPASTSGYIEPSAISDHDALGTGTEYRSYDQSEMFPIAERML